MQLETWGNQLEMFTPLPTGKCSLDASSVLTEARPDCDSQNPRNTYTYTSKVNGEDSKRVPSQVGRFDTFQ